MINDFIPEKFSRFLAPLEKVAGSGSASISIVGSYGNPNKEPTESSDLDLIFVFDVDSAYRTYQKCLSDLHTIENLEVVELGVHFQYGFVLSLYYRDNPLCWIDVGIMDVAFSENYLVDLPKKDVYGSIQSGGIKQKPLHQMNHLARKILKSRDTQGLSIDVACYRYLAWLKVYSEIQVIKNKPSKAALEIIGLFRPCKSEVKKEDVLKIVMHDICLRFPSMVASIT